MERSTIISDADCPKCQQVMNWHSVQESGTKRLNVFHCESCNARRRSCVRSANVLVLERLCRPPQLAATLFPNGSPIRRPLLDKADIGLRGQNILVTTGERLSARHAAPL